MLETLGRQGAEAAPLLATRSVSGGPLSAACWGTLRDGLLERLRQAGPVDGVLLSLHGSMLAEEEDDPEGALLAAVRAIVGGRVPIVATLDLHANVTARTVANADALVAYRRYPHDDVRATGVRGAELLLDALRGRVRPAMALAKVPMLVSGCEGQTFGNGPMAHLTQRAREEETRPGVVSVSCLHVHPYLDQPGLGCGAVVVTDDDLPLATSQAQSLAEAFWARRWAFMPEELSVAEAVALRRATEGGPVLLVDCADCCSGAAGDSVALPRELLTAGITESALTMVVDPAAAEGCARAGVGAGVTLHLGHAFDPAWGEPLTMKGRVRHLRDGDFRYEGGPFGGAWTSAGRSAVLEIGPVSALVMSEPAYDWGDEQYRAAGLDPAQARFVGVKNPMNYHFAYRDVAKAAFVVRTPGPTPATVRHLSYRRIERPIFPFSDQETPWRIEIAATSCGD